MKKVEMFEEASICQLEMEVNKFLEQVKGINIVDIKYSPVACKTYETYSAMIIYEENKDINSDYFRILANKISFVMSKKTICDKNYKILESVFQDLIDFTKNVEDNNGN